MFQLQQDESKMLENALCFISVFCVFAAFSTSSVLFETGRMEFAKDLFVLCTSLSLAIKTIQEQH